MAKRVTVIQPGRNDPCPCGSGKKFKKCHLGNYPQDPAWTQVDPAYRQQRVEAVRIQRERQQGLGKPIISVQHGGERFITVRNRLFRSDRFKTFHDFLVRYLAAAFGAEWGAEELRKPEAERHPVVLWYQALCRHQRKYMSGSGGVQVVPQSGAVAAYMNFAYDVFQLDNNAHLQERLLQRLRNPRTFFAARYETYVAAVFVRAGFDLEFENEQDGTTTHCEFTATHRGTGRKFSVEAKRRESGPLGIRPFNRALAKQANHARIVFLDINTADDGRGEDRPYSLTRLRDLIRAEEGRLLNGKPRPPAYVVMTNRPWEHDLDELAARSTYLVEGFQIDDFKEDGELPTLRAAINAREAHRELHALMQSMADHSEIPSTFDGELDVYSGSHSLVRVTVGSRYLFPDPAGGQRVGLVTSAKVMENEAMAYCGVTLDGTNQASIYRFPLSDEELGAYRRHPDTFFGVPEQRITRAETPLDLYDHFLEVYGQTPKNLLLEFMSSWPNHAHLTTLRQPELASLYAEGLAVTVFRDGRRATRSPQQNS